MEKHTNKKGWKIIATQEREIRKKEILNVLKHS